MKRPLEASFIELTFDASRDDDGFDTSDELRERARQIILSPSRTPRCGCSRSSSSVEYVSSPRGREGLRERRRGGSRGLAPAAGRRSIRDRHGVPGQLSEMLFVLGDYEGALLNARETLRRSTASGANGDHMALADPREPRGLSEIVETFEPYADAMVESPLDYQRSVTLLVLGHLGAGDVDGAWRILKSMQEEIGAEAAAYLSLTSIPKAPRARAAYA